MNIEMKTGRDVMTDIVKRLRDWCEDPHDVSMGELAEYSHKAADEIERLREALTQVVVYYEGFTLTIEEVVADARAALKEKE